jgi:hypothetical protein
MKARVRARRSIRSSKLDSGHAELGRIAGDLHLSHQGEHVREQARLQQHSGVELPRGGMSRAPLKQTRQGIEQGIEDRHGKVVKIRGGAHGLGSQKMERGMNRKVRRGTTKGILRSMGTIGRCSG